MSRYTPEQWLKTALVTSKAAHLLYEAGLYRDCANRAYYAAYQAATSICVKHGDAVNFAHDWDNPGHEQVPVFIRQNGDIPKEARREISRSLIALRAAREEADYKPGLTVDKITAQDCIRQMTQAMFYLRPLA